MKTPREILLKRHQSANAKLDKLRSEVLSTAWSRSPCTVGQDVDRKAPLPVRVALAVWRELIWPCRHAWTGMAALWLVLWGINLRLFDTPTTAAGARLASAPEMLEALQEQRRLLAELIAPADNQPAQLPHPNPQLRRRSTL